jgi:hypothetical protein
LVFLDEYDSFEKDGFASLYREYVLNAFRQRRNIEYALDLAIAAGIYDDSITPELNRLLAASVSSGIKLSCLDYVLCFRKKLRTAKAKRLANLARNRSRDVHVTVTAALIQAIYNKKSAVADVLREVQTTAIPSVVYRVINIVNSTKELSYLRRRLFEQLQEFINTLNTNQAQKKDLMQLITSDH